ncbi:MAG: alpha/beta fold hydrolase [Planctomycetota bacterium]
MAGLLILLAAGGALYVAALSLVTLRSLARPPRMTYATAVARGKPGDPSELDEPLAFEEWSFTSRGRTLMAWDLPGGDPSGPTAIVTHGWGTGRVSTLRRLHAIVPHAARVVCWDLPGHGESEGWCSLGVLEVDALLDLVSAVDAGGPLAITGSSMGGGVGIAAATEIDAALVIAESPYRIPPTPARNVMGQMGAPLWPNLPIALALVGLLASRRWLGPRLTPVRGKPFDRAELAATLRCPLLVLHGDQDETCPIDDGQAIAEAAPDGRFVAIAGGMHNTLWTEPACSAIMEREYQRALAGLRQPADARAPAHAGGRARSDDA